MTALIDGMESVQMTAADAQQLGFDVDSQCVCYPQIQEPKGMIILNKCNNLPFPRFENYYYNKYNELVVSISKFKKVWTSLNQFEPVWKVLANLSKGEPNWTSVGQVWASVVSLS